MFNLNPEKLTFQTIQTRYISDQTHLLKNWDITKLLELRTYLVDFKKMVQIY